MKNCDSFHVASSSCLILDTNMILKFPKVLASQNARFLFLAKLHLEKGRQRRLLNEMLQVCKTSDDAFNFEYIAYCFR